MRKISTILKTAMFASAVLLACKSFAAVDPYELEGQWEFTATLQIVDEDYSAKLLNNNIVTIVATNKTTMRFENFVWVDSKRVVSNSWEVYQDGKWVSGPANEMSFNTINADGGQGSYITCIANSEGTNPTGAKDRNFYYLHPVQESTDLITIPDFTIVTVLVDGGADDATEIIARYSNVKMTRIEEEVGDTHNFQGLYTVSGTKTTFVDGGIVDSSEEESSFQMQIWNGDTRFVFQQFAGFNDITGVRNGMTGSAKENELSFGYGWPFLESYTGDTLAESYFFTLGAGEIEMDGGVPVNKGETYIVLTYNEDGSYSLDDFTVWKRMYNDVGSAGTLLERWSNLTVTQTMDADGVDSISKDEVDAPAVYFNLQGVQVANPSNGIFIKKQGDKATKVVIK